MRWHFIVSVFYNLIKVLKRKCTLGNCTEGVNVLSVNHGCSRNGKLSVCLRKKEISNPPLALLFCSFRFTGRKISYETLCSQT